MFGSGDCVEPEQMIDRLRNSVVAACWSAAARCAIPWIFEQAADLAAGRTPREISPAERGQFLLDYIDLLLKEHSTEAAGFRHVAPGQAPSTDRPGARARALGDQQAAGAELLVHQGSRQRLAPAGRRSTRPSRSRSCARSSKSSFFEAWLGRVQRPGPTAVGEPLPGPPPHSRRPATPTRRS